MKRLLILLTLSIAASGTAYADECKSAEYFMKQGNYAGVRTIAEPLADKGVACGQYYLGRLYVHGHGIKRDKKKGLALIEEAEKAGYEKAKQFFATYH